MEITFIFRSKELHAYSVEKLFSSVIPEIKRTNIVKKRYMPEYRVSISNILKNINYARRISATNDSDIYHITGDVYYSSIGLPRDNTVLTVLDTVPLHVNKGLKRSILKLLWFTIPIRKCKFVTAISEKTKHELVQLFPFAENKITVVPCPVDDCFTYKDKKFNEVNPVILIVGTKENKNVCRILEALNGISCEVHIIGKLNERHMEAIHNNNINCKNYFNVSDEEILHEYQNADMLIFASTYEGFGMPIIEAQATGRAVITSNLEPMISVAGDGACFVDPFDIESIHLGVKKIIKDNSYRSSLIERGIENAKKYKAAHIANQYMEVYKRVVADNTRRK